MKLGVRWGTVVTVEFSKKIVDGMSGWEIVDITLVRIQAPESCGISCIPQSTEANPWILEGEWGLMTK
jgi:hypothetical protein